MGDHVTIKKTWCGLTFYESQSIVSCIYYALYIFLKNPNKTTTIKQNKNNNNGKTVFDLFCFSVSFALKSKVQALNPGHAFRLSGLFCPQLLVIDNTLGVDALNMTRRFPPTRGFLSHFS